jgi:NitT/TauT family transport system substrate-binding protein
MMRIGKATALAAVLSLVITICVAQGRDQKEITISGMTWAGVGPAFVASEKGFFSPLKVTLKVLDDTKARYAALASGDAQIMITNPDQHVREHEAGLPGKLLWLSDISHGADGIVVKPGISQVRELRGKRVGLTLGTASEYLLFRALTEAGLKISDVTLVEVDDQNAIAAAFQAGTLDAAVVWEPILSDVANKTAGKVLLTSADVPDSIIGIFVVSDPLLRDEATLKLLLDGWMKALDFIKNNPKEGSEIMAKGFSVSPDEVDGMVAGLRFADRELNRAYFCASSGQPSRLESFLARASEYWISVGKLKAAPTPSDRVAPFAVAYFCR